MKIIITRPRAQAESFGEALQSAGYEPIYFPVIEIRPTECNAELDLALKNLAKYDWVVFTSVNAVDVFFEKGRPQESPLPCIAAIGPKTADALRKHNIEPDFIPAEYVAEAILPGLGGLNNKWVLLPRAEIARKVLPEAIVKAGGIAHEIVVYQTLPAEVDMDGLNALKSGVDVITFTSASTVQNFVALVRQNKLDPLSLPNNPLLACIGPITEQAARKEGLSNIVVAKEYTTEGLIQTINNLEKL
ncbi:MAG: uroporphyrinogen-III synthase [Anaerolineales bacterium]|nr:uroporphyrinogen-III synthase [Anaerolineales bacterium]